MGNNIGTEKAKCENKVMDVRTNAEPIKVLVKKTKLSPRVCDSNTPKFVDSDSDVWKGHCGM